MITIKLILRTSKQSLRCSCNACRKSVYIVYSGLQGCKQTIFLFCDDELFNIRVARHSPQLCYPALLCVYCLWDKSLRPNKKIQTNQRPNRTVPATSPLVCMRKGLVPGTQSCYKSLQHVSVVIFHQ